MNEEIQDLKNHIEWVEAFRPRFAALTDILELNSHWGDIYVVLKNKVARLKGIEEAVKNLLALPNVENRCPWKDIHDAVVELERSYKRLEHETAE